MKWNVSSARQKSAILDIIYRCSFDKYPTKWDYTCQRLECYINGKEPIPQQELYLPDLTMAKLQEIRDGLKGELKTHFNWV